MSSTADRVVSTSPQAPDDIVADLPAATAEDVGRAATQARTAQKAWWSGGAAARAAALDGLADRLVARSSEAADLLVREVGKPRTEATGEVARAVSILRYYAQQAFDPVGATYPPSLGGRLWTERRPHGVAALVTPWNFPLAIPLWKAAPALATGNAVLLKPSPDAVACALLLAEVADGVLPDGLLHVLAGGAETGQAVTAHGDVVSFTGSVDVGRQVLAAVAPEGRAVQAEMGGQNAAIVLPDADIATTAAHLAAAAMGYAGQKCTATRRVVVVGAADALRDALTAAVDALALGDPGDPATVVGPVISKTARAKVHDATGAARADGARILTGGSEPAEKGWYVGPTVVDGLAADHRLATTEVFGPLVTLHQVATVAEAVALANAVPYGLVSSVHGRDLEAVLRVVDGLDTGLVKVNAPTTGVDFYAPFGGEKASSAGPREQGKAALDFYSSTRTVTLAPPPATP